MVHGSDARAMASVRGLLNIQSLNESSTHEKSPFNAPCHIWCYGPVCVSARDSARCLRGGADHAIGGRANGERSAVFYVLNIQSLNESSTHEKGLTRGTRCALCAVCCGPVRNDRRPPCSGSAETGRVPRRKAGRALDNDSRSISLLSYIAGASRASSALSTSSRIHHIRYLLQYHVALRPVAT
jgi:hypothetical protein